MTLKGAKPRQELRLWSCELGGCIDQELARKANTLRAHRGSEDREFRVRGHRGTANPESRYLTRGWHFANVGFLEISHLWEINPKFF